jgi:hypothetical protein
MTLRPVLLAFCLLAFTFAAEPVLAFGCGVGCYSTAGGACVREGWLEGLPVRNECPATSRPTPPCGSYHRWSRRAQMCVLR